MATTSPIAPRLVKGGLVIMDPSGSQAKSVIPFQYNPDSLQRSMQIQSLPGGSDGVRVDVLRLRGPALETIKVEAEFDAIDELEKPDSYPNTVAYGLHPRLAQLEMLINPSVETLYADNNMASAGSLEIIPLEQPLTLFVWSRSRVVPVRLTEFTITEEAFDTALNPIRAKVSLGMRILTIDDLGFDHPGSHLFLAYLTNKESLAGLAQSSALTVLGLRGLP